MAGQTQRRVVCKEEELPPGARRAVDVDGRSICVMNVRGRLYAVRNIGSTMLPSKPLEYVVGLEDLVLRCPWHGWEFRIDTGISLFDPKTRVKVYPVEVEDGEIVLDAG